MGNSSWSSVELGEVIDLYDSKRIPLSGKQRAERQGSYPYYGASGIIDYIDDYIFDGRYLLIAEDGENLNSRKLPIAFWGNGKFWVNNHAHIILGKEGIADTDFIRHYLLQANISGYITGAAQPKLSQGNLRRIQISLPEYDEQLKISSTLSTYDNLIENNNRRIAILEEMAQSLYREWFVKFRFPGHDQCQMVESPLGLIPEGWEVKTLKKSMELAYGKALKKADRKGGEVAVYGSGGIGGFHNTALVNGPCIIVGRKGNVGSIFWCEHDCWPIDTVFYVKSEHSKYYLYFNLLHQTFHNSDAAVPGLNRESAYSNKLILPETEVVAKFDEIIDPMFSQLKNLRAKNENLKKQRDLLLPKLISGQIDLSQAEQASA